MHIFLVFEQGDPVLIAVFLILVLMSIISWSIIVARSFEFFLVNRRNEKAQALFWSTQKLLSAEHVFKDMNAPFGTLTASAIDAKNRYIQHHSDDLVLAGISLNEYVVSQIRNSMSQILRHFDRGLTMLASIGATSPFIGLFGTVWGIYQALMSISDIGELSLSAITAPIGEALIATAAGLFVAIPAVLAYNALNRRNKSLSQDMDGFAYDLHVRLLQSKE